MRGILPSNKRIKCDLRILQNVHSSCYTPADFRKCRVLSQMAVTWRRKIFIGLAGRECISREQSA